jgi:hypothetical protein
MHEVASRHCGLRSTLGLACSRDCLGTSSRVEVYSWMLVLASRYCLPGGSPCPSGASSTGWQVEPSKDCRQRTAGDGAVGKLG